MSWNGKIVGAFLGYWIGGFFGAIVGLFIGHAFDKGILQTLMSLHAYAGRQEPIREVFFQSTFSIMGYVAKADGRVTEKEIETARKIMFDMGLSEAAKARAMQEFSRGKQADFDVQAEIYRLKQACFANPGLLKNFLEIQIQIAEADQLTPKKKAAVEFIIRQFGLQGFHFGGFHQQYSQGQYQRQHYQQQAPQYSIETAYKTLGVTKAQSDEEIKKAYRKLMSQNHPDKLMSKGLPPEMIKMANQKTQKIKEAYEEIKKARGMR